MRHHSEDQVIKKTGRILRGPHEHRGQDAIALRLLPHSASPKPKGQLGKEAPVITPTASVRARVKTPIMAVMCLSQRRQQQGLKTASARHEGLGFLHSSCVMTAPAD